jgi:hypothetical protein
MKIILYICFFVLSVYFFFPFMWKYLPNKETFPILSHNDNEKKNSINISGTFLGWLLTTFLCACCSKSQKKQTKSVLLQLATSETNLQNIYIANSLFSSENINLIMVPSYHDNKKKIIYCEVNRWLVNHTANDMRAVLLVENVWFSRSLSDETFHISLKKYK